MSANTRSDLPPHSERNPITTARFRRETWWQITFPVLAVAIISVVLVVLVVVLGQQPGASIVADYSLMLLIIPSLVCGLIMLVVIAGLSYLTARLIRGMPPYAYTVHRKVAGVHRWVDKTTNRIAGVVITAKGFLVGLDVYLKARGIIPDTEEESASERTQPEPSSD